MTASSTSALCAAICSGFASSGAVSRPSSVVSLREAASKWTRNPPPPSPEDCGSTSPSTSCAAIMASTAEPPLARMSLAALVAAGSAVTAMKLAAVTRALASRPVAASGATSCADAGRVSSSKAASAEANIAGAFTR